MTTLYGRDEEFAELLEVWDAVKTGQGPRTLVVANALIDQVRRG